MTVLYLLLSVVLIVFLTVRWKVHPFLALLLTAILYGFAAGMPTTDIIASINTGFGETLGKIGLIIVLGVIIGAFLENSGGAFALADKVLSIIGKKRVPAAMGIIGYIVSIPVFADSGFLLVSSLNKSLSKKAGITLATSAIALSMGLIATHTMVPPTPGPIAAAGILNADLGLVLALGLLVSAVATLAGVIFAQKVASKTWIDPVPDVDEKEIAQRLKDAPSAFKSSLPIIVPIVLIVLKSVFAARTEEQTALVKLLGFIGEPVIALLIGMFLALLLPKKFERDMLSVTGWTGQAMGTAASIILITGAGGIFGKILQNSGIADLLGEALSGFHLSLWLPFMLAAAIKTAQGSSTVSLITTASIMAPLMATLGFESEVEKALVVLAIGAGSAMVSHANDSFFWVVTQLSGMDVKTGYRLQSLGTLVIGLAAILAIFGIYLFIS